MKLEITRVSVFQTNVEAIPTKKNRIPVIKIVLYSVSELKELLTLNFSSGSFL